MIKARCKEYLYKGTPLIVNENFYIVEFLIKKDEEDFYVYSIKESNEINEFQNTVFYGQDLSITEN